MDLDIISYMDPMCTLHQLRFLTSKIITRSPFNNKYCYPCFFTNKTACIITDLNHIYTFIHLTYFHRFLLVKQCLCCWIKQCHNNAQCSQKVRESAWLAMTPPAYLQGTPWIFLRLSDGEGFDGIFFAVAVYGDVPRFCVQIAPWFTTN